MAWQDTGITILKAILNDACCGTSTFSDSRLLDLLIAAAYCNLTAINWSTTYTINVGKQTISPDPLTDVDFMNFMILKAACLADQGLFRTKALQAGLEARCGPAILKTTQHLQGFNTLLEEGPCKAYEEMRCEFIFNNNRAIRAILSPFVGNNFDPGLQHNRAGTRTL
jgi:hypothetical protein